MKRWLPIASFAFLALAVGCDSDDNPDPNNPNPNNPDNGTPSETAPKERDGIPSGDSADRLLYFVSTEESAPGLYAYRPSTPEEPPAYIDAELNVVDPFHHPVHRSTFAPDGSITEFYIGGVFYQRYLTPLSPGTHETVNGLSHLASTEPSQLQSTPPQITNNETGPAFIASFGGLFSFNLQDITQSSFLTSSDDGPFRYDFDLGANEPALALPEGTALGSFLGDGSSQHEHWLYINQDGSLVFYDRDFASSAPVLDDDTDAPLLGLSEWSRLVVSLNENDALAVLAEDSQSNDDEILGSLYRVSRPSAGNPGGTAKLLRNAEGETLEFAVGMFVMTRGVPSEPQLYVDKDVAYFADGAAFFNTSWTTFTRATRDGWEAFSHKKALEDEGVTGGNPMMVSNLPPVFIPVPGHGTFWAPASKPELIVPTSGDAQAWERIPLDLPAPEQTTIFNSANGWIYYDYQGSGFGALAYHVPTKQRIEMRGAKWLGASSVGARSIGGTQALSTPSEVFVLLKDSRLAAFEAAAPDKGMVILGTIPEDFRALNLFGLGRGPHRLFQLIHEDKSAEVLYVDTRSKGSLKSLMDTPATEWDRPATDDPEDEETVYPEHTRPVNLF